MQHTTHHTEHTLLSHPAIAYACAQGHLYKLGRFKRWEKKWFVLDIKFLTSYATFEVRIAPRSMCVW